MGIIQKNPLDGMASQFYTIGLNNNVVIVGLGNIGDRYKDTRHNVGFTCIDEFAVINKFDPWMEKKDLKCLYSSQNMGSTRVIIMKPTTLMNLSGDAIQAVLNFFKLSVANVAVVHDELDIPFGQIRTRKDGSDAGHKGIKSISDQLGESYGRIRVGIGPKTPEQIDSSDFVLSKFSTDELNHMPDLTKEVNAILTEFIFGGQLNSETRHFLI
jgi:PTH1 family peptidyl-tRNA hydrolase